MAQQPPHPTALVRPKSRIAQSAVLAAVAAAGGLAGGYRLADKPTSPAPVPAVYFSPPGGCAQAVTEAVNNAKAEVCVQAYTFDSSAIANGLAEARRRGVKVMVVMDAGKCYDDRNRAGWLHERGVPVRVDSRHTIAHNKVMIIDGTTVITGSFNFTEVAEKSHAENLLVLREPTVAAKYHANWQAHWNHSTPFEPRKPATITGTITPEEAVRCEGKECAVEMTVTSVWETSGLYFIGSS
jgi:phosphatidylserine/phosphatidylglycerophosphate/cardiolipin synthase-like enzyme